LKKAISFLLATMMAASVCVLPAAAEDTAAADSAAVPQAETAETAQAASYAEPAPDALQTAETAATEETAEYQTAATRSANAEEQQKILDEVKTLQPGVDYLENCALFWADSEGEAREVAERLGAKLAYYKYESATITFDKTVVELMTDAINSESDLPLIYADHIYSMPQVQGDNEGVLSTLSDWMSTMSYKFNDPNQIYEWQNNFIGTETAFNKNVTGKGVTVAVLDTGVTADHTDLHVSKGHNSLGSHWAETSTDDSVDHNGHGTKAAGVIAMLANNGRGGVGVAPDVTLVACKSATDKGYFYDDTIFNGVNDAVSDGADVIYIGCAVKSDNSGYLQKAIDTAVSHSAVIVCASGNDGTAESYFLPSNKYVIGVGAINSNKSKMDASNYGSNVNIVAPGNALYTTTYDGGYGTSYSDTSAAAAVVAGAVALAISADSDLLNTAQNGNGSLKGADFIMEVQNRIYDTATDLGNTNQFGHGYVNVSNLINNGNFSGLRQDSDGVWRYYQNGKIATDYTGLVQYSGAWYYVQSGILNWGYSGLAQYNGTWFYVQNSTLKWGYTGLVLSNGTWYYVQDSTLKWGYNGLAQYGNTWYYVQNSTLVWGYKGLALNPANSTWYYVENSTLSWNYTGLAYNPANSTWYYIQNGTLYWGYTGLAYNSANSTWYYIQNSTLVWGYSGLAYNQANSTWYYVQNSTLNWGYNGMGYNNANGKWYYFQNSTLTWNYTGLGYNSTNKNWYYFAKSQLDWSYVGAVEYNNVWYYVGNGVLDWGYNGYVVVNGKSHKVINGVVQGM
jgi:subtilisin family serine protease